MVFAVGAGNPYAQFSGAQSIENASAEIAAAKHPDMRVWFVPSPKTSQVVVPAGSELAKRHYVRENKGRVYVGREVPQANLTGGCNMGKMCDKSDKEKKNWGCENECHTDDDELVHEWTPITPETVGPLSAVCYLAVRDVKAGATPGRPVGIIASYVGGTPVGCWVNDMHADETCHVTPRPEKNVPCDRTKACCPGHLYNDKVAPLLPFNARAVLWYQGEANTDEGYTRTREEYACQMRLLITSWRKSWGYNLPFFWMQLHGWGLGGGASDSTCFWGGGPHVYDLDCTMAIRLAQADVAADASLGLGTIGLASAADCCQADAPAPDGSGGHTCNLHPGFKSLPAKRLAWEVMAKLFGKTAYPARPVFVNASYSLSTGTGTGTAASAGGAGAGGGQTVTVKFALANADGLQLQPIHDWRRIWGGVGCGRGASGLVVLNATVDGAPRLINGTASVADGVFTGTWTSPYVSDGGPVGSNITAVHAVRYMDNNVPTCVVANGGGRPLGPILHKF